MARSRAIRVIPGTVGAAASAEPDLSDAGRRPRRLPPRALEGPPATTVFERRDLPGAQWLTVHGPMTVAALADLAVEVAACDGSRALLLDLSRATDIDGSDLAAIAGLYGALAARAAALLVLPGESTRLTAGLIKRLLGARVTIVDREGWGSRPGGWLSLTEHTSPPALREAFVE